MADITAEIFTARFDDMFSADASGPVAIGAPLLARVLTKKHVQLASKVIVDMPERSRCYREPPGSRSRDCFLCLDSNPTPSPQSPTSYGRHPHRYGPVEKPLERGTPRSHACGSRAAGGHEAADMGVARRQVGARRRFWAPSMRTRWDARGGVCRAVASGLCVERGGRDRADARNRAKTIL